MAFVWIGVVVLKIFSSVGQKLQRRGGGENMALLVIEILPASSKPPAGIDVCISSGERHGFGALAASFTRASSRHAEELEARRSHP